MSEVKHVCLVHILVYYYLRNPVFGSKSNPNIHLQYPDQKVSSNTI